MEPASSRVVRRSTTAALAAGRAPHSPILRFTSGSRTTMTSVGCLLLPVPVQRATSRIWLMVGSSTGSAVYSRTARRLRMSLRKPALGFLAGAALGIVVLRRRSGCSALWHSVAHERPARPAPAALPLPAAAQLDQRSEAVLLGGRVPRVLSVLSRHPL